MTMLHEDKMSLDNALKHYGVMGMKWGVTRTDKQLSARKQVKQETYGGKDKKARTSVQKNARAERKARRVGTAYLVATGVIFAAGIIADINTSGRQPNLSDFSKASTAVSDIINKERKIKVDAINKTYREGFIDEDQQKHFVGVMNKKYDRKLADAVS
jgi:hypothetical protein